MASRNLFDAHLKKLEDYLGELEKLRTTAVDEFLEDRGLQDRVERNFHLAIECALDIGNQLISERGFRLPDTYGDVFQVLAENKVISKEFAGNLVKMAGFRNILVHDYLKIDKSTVHTNLDKLSDFRTFAEAVSKYVDET